MGQKERKGADATADAPSAAVRLTPIDIQQKEFRVSRFGGYKMRDVDEFLDQITDSFTALSAEVDRLRAGGAGPVVGSPDLDDVSRQADEIIARARAEAARITDEARSTDPPPTSVPEASARGRQDRTAVNAFIVQEREFLQSLAGLVQEHAEAVKGMARSSKSATEASKPSPQERSAAAPADASSEARSAQSGGAPRSSTAAEDVGREGSPPSEGGSDDEPTVRIEEPTPAGASRSESDHEGDRSLRELFWGED
jgi:DivIVA domain-containing protein